MRTTAGIAAAALLLAATACAAPPSSPPTTPTTPTDASPTSSGTSGPETITYDDVGHQMDIYRPPGDTQPTMVVLLVHGVGAGASPKDHPGFSTWGARLSEAGVVAAIPNYDAVLGGSEEGTAQLGRAIAVVRERVAGPDGKPAALVTMGFSAGGPDWVAASFDPANQPVSALVGYYADIEPDRASGVHSLSSQLAGDPKPVLLAYGDQDDAPGILDSLRAFRRAIAGAPGRRTTILTHPRGGHGFDLGNDRRTREIIRRTLAFVAGRD